MLERLAADTGVIAYLMAAAGILGILAKIVNQITLNRLVREAGNMPKSTHRLIKLVRSKYEHACMIRDSVENTDAFVEKYIFEYRGFLFRIHTWRQIEILTVDPDGMVCRHTGGAWRVSTLLFFRIQRIRLSIYHGGRRGGGAAVHGHAPDGRAVQDPRPENVYDGLSGKYLYIPASAAGDPGA